TDDQGRLVWDARDRQLNTDALATRADGAATAPQTGGQLAGSQTREMLLSGGLLPGEGDFQVILIDALDGNDKITVGPTVQRTVWIDAGPGDDHVDIQSGNAILVDQTEQRNRNDNQTHAFALTSPGASAGAIAGSVQFNGLTIDNPNDVDWY